jgi:hypothetical protein
MWVQVMEGKAKDAAGLRKQFERWNEEVRPKAKGFLGATAGVTDDGTFINIARFESEELAMQNNDVSEQKAWYEETSQYFDGEPTFRNCNEVDSVRGGGSNDAGFVQVIQSELKDFERGRELNRKMNDMMPADMRPEFLGGITAWDGQVLTMTAYFTSEAEAREGEKQDMNEFAEKYPEAAQLWQEMNELETNQRYYDLRDPFMI